MSQLLPISPPTLRCTVIFCAPSTLFRGIENSPTGKTPSTPTVCVFSDPLATVFPALSVIDQRIFAFRRAEPLKLYTSAFAVKVSSQNHALFG